MVKAIILTNIIEGLPQSELEKYLKNIQGVAGNYNMVITGAVIDRSNGENPYFSETIDILEEQLADERFDVIVLDDTYDYEMSESYVKLSEWADSYNISIFHFEDNDIYMPDSNDDFDFDDVPFEVFELKRDDAENKFFGDFTSGIAEICNSFRDHMKEMPFCVKCNETTAFIFQLSQAAGVLLQQADDMEKELNSELAAARKKAKKSK